MICNECKLELDNIQEGDKHVHPLIDIVKKYKVPFKCNTCGSLKFPYQALHGIVFIWPKPIEEKTKGGIVIPQSVRHSFKTSIGVVLSSGKGCKNKKTGKFVDSELQLGDTVVYDKNIPWRIFLEASDGKEYEVELMNILDITARYVKESENGK